jgi:hypothetical protein
VEFYCKSNCRKAGDWLTMTLTERNGMDHQPLVHAPRCNQDLYAIKRSSGGVAASWRHEESNWYSNTQRKGHVYLGIQGETSQHILHSKLSLRLSPLLYTECLLFYYTLLRRMCIQKVTHSSRKFPPTAITNKQLTLCTKILFIN